MTGAMYSSIAGLKAHMQKLTVIGNNVANVNTQGYKKQRTIFRDSIYSMYSGGSNGTDIVGSMNPSQLGYGSLVASIDLDMSSSSYSPGNPSDCALVGEGFFLVGNKDIANTIDPMNPETFKSLTLSRLGDFHIGADGYLVDGQGNAVYGFMNTGTGSRRDPNDETKTIPDISDQLVPIRLPYWERDDDTGEYTIHYAQVHEKNQDGTLVEAECALYDDKIVNVTNEEGQTVERTLDYADIESITISPDNGCISGIVRGSNEPITIGYLAIGNVTNANGVTHVDSSYYSCGDGAGDLRIGMLGGINRQLELQNINSYQARVRDAQGNLTDQMADLPVGSAIISNGNTKMMVGFLETSNVDLATEISELITTQRGYQANTRIITVTDSMLEELVNIKR